MAVMLVDSVFFLVMVSTACIDRQASTPVHSLIPIIDISCVSRKE
jgi:hypothetical protein